MAPSPLPMWALLAPFTGTALGFVVPARVGPWIPVAASAATIAIGSALLAATFDGVPIAYALGNFPLPFGVPLVADALSSLLVVLAGAISLVAAGYTIVSGHPAPNRRFHTALSATLAGVVGTFLTGDLFDFYVFVEVTVVASTPLLALAGGRDAPEATLKYVVLTLFGSAVLVLGVALTYAQAGTLNLGDLARRSAAGSGPGEIAGALLAAGMLVKAAAFPFHAWQPDAHSAAPAGVSALLSGLLVNVGVYALLRVDALLGVGPALRTAMAAVGVVSALFGALAAGGTREAKRVLAYSTISQMGFAVAAVSWAGRGGARAEAAAAAVLLLVAHAVAKTALFLVVGHVVERTGARETRDLGGLARLSPPLAAGLGAGLASLAGIPPTSGFVAKLAILRAGLDANDTLAVLGLVVASVVSIAYGARAFALLAWRTPTEASLARWRSGRSAAAPIALGTTLAALAVVLGPACAPLCALAERAGAAATNVDAYARAALGEGT